jgi:hypothetical protein
MAAHHCRVSQAAAVAMCDALVDILDGASPGKLVIYTGAEPATANTAAATEVATITLNNPAFGAAAYSGGNLAAEADLDVDPDLEDASATGNASAITHFRLCKSDDTCIVQGTASATAGDDLVSNAAIIAAGSSVAVTALKISVPINQA